ncbi:VOC family protein [Solicola gregarius]|uniref:VOC family protein n=1 Tax=Solicola gregarius TaxID=2908642 RepID=A0AA46TJE1_9ACTN|nr:VOC family protein [Solicola gregarius]UYM06213.1 VOC family protein [Solicola gregarius]
MPRIRNCLWFDDNGEAAARFYTDVFPNSTITEITHYGSAGPMPAGSVMTVLFELDGTPFMVLNGGEAGFRFDESISFVVDCADQDEVDHYWDALGADGQPGPCGWVKDRYGVSWQIVPTRLDELVGDPDPERGQRAMAAMLTMGKIDIAELERAADAG